MKTTALGQSLLLSLLLMCISIPATVVLSDDSTTPGYVDYETEILDWRKRRQERLTSTSGYLAQVGLEWLEEGLNRVGQQDASNVRIHGGPDHWGDIIVAGEQLKFVPNPDADIKIDGSAATEVVLIADNQGEPTIVSSGNLSFYIIYRASYAVRVKDTQSPDLLAFTAVDNYQIQESWRISGDFIRAPQGQTIEVANVLGQLENSPVYGTFAFERDGNSHNLIALGEEGSQSLWFLFADKTSGHETYGAGRYLYSDGMPENGRLVVDFNKAYNPPCAFNEFSTCPLTPQQNRLRMAVRAGEKKYHHD